MTVADTSLLAYFGEVLPALGNRQQAVLLAFMEKESFTNAEVADFLQFPINTITPRVLELRIKGMLELDQVRPCKVTGRRAMAWRIKKVVGQVALL